MKIHTIAALSIPLVLLACGGAGSSADLTEPQSTGPRPPDLSQPAPTRPASVDALDPTGTAGTAELDAQQLLQAQVASAALTLDDATDIALAANPGSQVLEADLDGDGASPRYEVELRLADGQVVEVRVDAVTGEILATVPEDADDDNDDDDDDGDGDDDVAIDCTGAIGAVEAQAVAEAEAGGTAVEVEVDDGCQFEVTVETATGFVEVDVAQDGTVQKVENDDDGPGDSDDDDGPDDDDDGDDDDDDGDDD